MKRYRVTVERRKNKYNKMVSLSEAVVVVKIGDKKMLSVSESMDEEGTDRGPVNALAKALAKDLGPWQSVIDDMKLVDFKGDSPCTDRFLGRAGGRLLWCSGTGRCLRLQVC